MITVDFIGLLLTACIVGFRYPFYVLSAVLIHEAGKIALAVFLQGNVERIVVSGVFGVTTVSHLSNEIKGALVTFGGPLANYVLSSTVGGVEWERTKNLYNPFSTLRYPFAVIHLRFAAVSFFVSLLRLF